MDTHDGPLIEHAFVLVSQLWIICSVYRRSSSGWHHVYGVLLVHSPSLNRQTLDTTSYVATCWRDHIAGSSGRGQVVHLERRDLRKVPDHLVLILLAILCSIWTKQLLSVPFSGLEKVLLTERLVWILDLWREELC
jgi:hypothetical protein